MPATARAADGADGEGEATRDDGEAERRRVDHGDVRDQLVDRPPGNFGEGTDRRDSPVID